VTATRANGGTGAAWPSPAGPWPSGLTHRRRLAAWVPGTGPAAVCSTAVVRVGEIHPSAQDDVPKVEGRPHRRTFGAIQNSDPKGGPRRTAAAIGLPGAVPWRHHPAHVAGRWPEVGPCGDEGRKGTACREWVNWARRGLIVAVVLGSGCHLSEHAQIPRNLSPNDLLCLKRPGSCVALARGWSAAGTTIPGATAMDEQAMLGEQVRQWESEGHWVDRGRCRHPVE